MLVETRSCCEDLVTVPTLKRLLSRVDPPVVHQISFRTKFLGAEITGKGKFTAMSTEVNLESK
jgi:hypothetical protein